MKVKWTDNAVAHLVNIYEYISLNSPTYAKQMVDKITRRSVQIASHPLSGRKVPEYDSEVIRELIEQPFPSSQSLHPTFGTLTVFSDRVV